MWQLYLGLSLFLGPHVYSLLAPRHRDGLRQQMGERSFKLAYSALVLAGLVLMAIAYVKGRAGPTALDFLYQPLDGARHPAMLLVLVAFILLSATGSRSHIRRWLRHPFSLGIMLWSAAHLLVNGESVVVLIFAGFLLLAGLDVALGLARGKPGPFEPSWAQDMRAVALGAVLFLVFLLGFHPYVLNVPVI